MRGRPKQIEDTPSPIKFEERYEYDDSIEIWKYDLNKTIAGPIEVIINYKNNTDKNWGNKYKKIKNGK
jgi:hypothetical protein